MRRLVLLLILLSAPAFAQNTVVTGESAGASTNPTSGTIPVKSGSGFIDSPESVSGGNVTNTGTYTAVSFLSTLSYWDYVCIGDPAAPAAGSLRVYCSSAAGNPLKVETSAAAISFIRPSASFLWTTDQASPGAPIASTTYFQGINSGGTGIWLTTTTNARRIVSPVACNINYISAQVWIDGTLPSAGSVTVAIRNDTQGTTSATVTRDWSTGGLRSQVTKGAIANFAVAQGDELIVTTVTPAWVTAPTVVYPTAQAFCQ